MGLKFFSIMMRSRYEKINFSVAQRSSLSGQWIEGRTRRIGRGRAEFDGSEPSNRSQPHHQGVRRPLSHRDGTDRWENEETHTGNEAVLHHASQRRQTMFV